MNDQPKDGGAAFPTLDHNGQSLVLREWGMSLRDYFAAQALTGIMAADDHTGDQRDIALVSYAIADAMLEARK